MRIIEKKVYQFGELSKDIQEKLIEKEKEYQKDIYCDSMLITDMEDIACQLLKKYFKDRAIFEAVYYSFSYCQGDGAMIEFKLEYYGKDIQIRHYGHYSHCRSFDIIHRGELTEKREEQLKEKIIAMNEELTEYGYKIIEFEISDKEVIEILEENEYYVNGEKYEGV